MAVEEKDFVEAIGRHKEDIAIIHGELQNHKATLDRHETALTDISQMQRSLDKLANNMQMMLEEQKAQGERLTVLEQKPAKKWDNLINVIIAALASGLIGYIIAQIFK